MKGSFRAGLEALRDSSCGEPGALPIHQQTLNQLRKMPLGTLSKADGGHDMFVSHIVHDALNRAYAGNIQ